jgi:hypothetical protein
MNIFSAFPGGVPKFYEIFFYHRLYMKGEGNGAQ